MTGQMKLYMTTMSGNSFKVRVLASILGIDIDEVHIDWDGREHKSSAFRARNPRGQVPVMDIEDRTFWDSTAHLVYLARARGADMATPKNRRLARPRTADAG
jgi:glutathione S-transferase